MIYFTLSGTDIYVDNGTSINYEPKVRRVKFGDGYELSIPVATLRAVAASFSNRTPAEINQIDSYLTSLQGGIIPNFYIMGEVVPMVCVSYGKSYQNGELFSLNAEFREELR
jgi:phage-related protein